MILIRSTHIISFAFSLLLFGKSSFAHVIPNSYLLSRAAVYNAACKPMLGSPKVLHAYKITKDERVSTLLGTPDLPGTHFPLHNFPKVVQDLVDSVELVAYDAL